MATKIAIIRSDLDFLPSSQFERELGPDKIWYYKAEFDIVVYLESASISFTFMYKGWKGVPSEVNYL